MKTRLGLRHALVFINRMIAGISHWAWNSSYHIYEIISDEIWYFLIEWISYSMLLQVIYMISILAQSMIPKIDDNMKNTGDDVDDDDGFQSLRIWLFFTHNCTALIFKSGGDWGFLLPAGQSVWSPYITRGVKILPHICLFSYNPLQESNLLKGLV